MINVNLFYLTLPLVYQLLLIQIAKVSPLHQLLYSCLQWISECDQRWYLFRCLNLFNQLYITSIGCGNPHKQNNVNSTQKKKLFFSFSSILKKTKIWLKRKIKLLVYITNIKENRLPGLQIHKPRWLYHKFSLLRTTYSFFWPRSTLRFTLFNCNQLECSLKQSEHNRFHKTVNG